MEPDKHSETEREVRLLLMTNVLKNRYVGQENASEIIIEVEQLVQYVLHGRKRVP